jgi:ABC-type transport system substrate-binding protein
MVFEAWEDYWRRVRAPKTIIVKGIRDPASRLASLKTGELDLAFGMTGKLLPRLINDRNLRWDPDLTAPRWLA